MIGVSAKVVLVCVALACRNEASDAPPPPPAPPPARPAPRDAAPDASPRDAGSAVQSYLLIHIASLAGVQHTDYFRYINERAYPRFARCYPPGVIGTIGIDFDVGTDGSIVAQIGRGFDVDIARCLVDVLDLIRLPTRNAGGHGELLFETRP